jgi:heme/copper-type cytochrome/quinol oxidase subunit 1
MPRLSVVLLRTALVSLLLGTALGGLQLAGVPALAAGHPGIRDAHRTLMLFGWLLPFVLGTGFWMLPRHAGDLPRGRDGLAWLAAVVYAAGAGMRLLEPLLSVRWGWDRAAGTGGIVLGAAGFVGLLWPRIKPFGAGRLPS